MIELLQMLLLLAWAARGSIKAVMLITAARHAIIIRYEAERFDCEEQTVAGFLWAPPARRQLLTFICKHPLRYKILSVLFVLHE